MISSSPNDDTSDLTGLDSHHILSSGNSHS